MNNSMRNFKMKKLLIATTALVATAGMANAEISIAGSAAAGIYSNLDATDAVAAVVGVVTAAEVTAVNTAHAAAITGAGTALVADANVASTDLEALMAAVTAQALTVAAEQLDFDAAAAAGQDTTQEAADLAAAQAVLALNEAKVAAASGTAAAPASNSGDGVYSQAGVDFTMTGETDNGISYSATVSADFGNEVDTGDFELDGVDANSASFGAISMTGTFGTLTFDDAGIDNLYDDDLAAADLSYSTTVGSVALSIASDVTAGSANANSFSASTTQSGMSFTLTGSETADGTSAALAMAYALNDTVSISASTDQVAGAESVQTIGATTALNGVSVSVSSANDSTWDVDLGYTAGGFALTYGVDETDAWTATATRSLGATSTFAAGVSSANEMYAGVSFTF
jgi:outer membrane protein OmpU